MKLLMAGVDKLTVPDMMRCCNTELRIGTGKTNSRSNTNLNQPRGNLLPLHSWFAKHPADPCR